MTKLRLLSLLLLGNLLMACGSQAVFEDQVDFDKGVWSEREPVSFTFEVKDASRPYQLNLHLRSSLDYTYHNIYFKYYLKDAEGKLLQELLEERLLFEATTGRPLGDGFGSVRELSVPVVENLQFADTGQYEIVFEQYMRIAELNGIWSVGASLLPAASQE